jgi:hypothetical protein
VAEMADFNIRALANFLPPEHLCEKCYALLLYPLGRGSKWKCPSVRWSTRPGRT